MIAVEDQKLEGNVEEFSIKDDENKEILTS